MKTRRLLSNISFNSYGFFVYVINDLISDGLIDWAYWIKHSPDSDDKKEHIHFCFQPSRAIDTVQLNQYFYEFPFYGVRKLRKPTIKYMPVISLDDWLLYCKHDVDYLTSKGLTRNYSYEWSQFGFSDEDAFYHDVNDIDYSRFNRLHFLREGVLSHTPFAELIQSGSIPIQFRAQYEAQFRALQRIELAKHRKFDFEQLDDEQVSF